MKQPGLFTPSRACVVCGNSAPFNRKFLSPGEPSILSMYTTIYRRTRAGRQLATSKTVQVCEECFGKVTGSQGSKLTIPAAVLAVAIFQRAADCYKAIADFGKGSVASKARTRRERYNTPAGEAD